MNQINIKTKRGEHIYFYLQVGSGAGALAQMVKPLDECTWLDHNGVITNYYKSKFHIHWPIDMTWWGLRNRPRCGEFVN